MESHGGRSLETPHGVASSGEERTITPLLSATDTLDVRDTLDVDDTLDVKESCESADHFRYGVDRGQVPPVSRRSNILVRVHSRPRVAVVTPPQPLTCVMQPITSSGSVRTSNFVRSTSRTSGNVRRNFSEFADSFASMSPSSVFSLPPIVRGMESVSPSRLPNSNFSHVPSSVTRSRIGNVSTSIEAVSLTLPRPETERTSNEYVETPLRSGISLIEPKLKTPSHRTLRTSTFNVRDVGDGRESNFAMVTLPVTGLERKYKHGERSSHRHREEKVVTSQPSATFKKDRCHSSSRCSRQNDDIICSECNRCRCEACRTPRPLPSKWLCGTCHCSADTIVDYATCLCCAKAFFYHCSNDETVSYENDPCSCSSDMCYARWGCLGLMSVFLPCLFCYWPCRGLVQICESCHQCFSSHGCRCQNSYTQPSTLTFEKRLLDSSE